MPVRLRRDVRISVLYEDRTLFGSPITTRPEETVASVYAPVLSHVQQHGDGEVVRLGPALLDEVVRSDAFRALAEPHADGTWRLRPEVLYPEVRACSPSRVKLTRGERTIGTDVPIAAWPDLHTLIAGLAGDGLASDAGGGQTAQLLEAMDRAGLLESTDNGAPAAVGGDFTFLGHNTVVVQSGTGTVIVDPWLRPGSERYPSAYQPLQLRDFPRIDAAVITHSHPDHFDPPTLLTLPRSTRIIIPKLERETILSTRMADRLRELGFTDITELEWWDSTRVKDIDIVALPFHGEQPTDGDQLHPDVRNAGNTYFIRTPRGSAAFLADSGRDGAGDARQVAARARLEVGSPDFLFVGYRGWLIYPVQLVNSSVGRYILFIPPHLWGVRQRLMTTADETIDLGEIWGAGHVVPYADGGAPWFWDINLGPRLDEAAREDKAFDPFPERVAEAARTRTEGANAMLGSTVEVLVLRPGDAIIGAQPPAIERMPGFAWPYSEALTPTRGSALLG
jgi:L-ascorbate metabolism protein UlaG (beta-lactamase superfamily)